MTREEIVDVLLTARIDLGKIIRMIENKEDVTDFQMQNDLDSICATLDDTCEEWSKGTGNEEDALITT